MLFEARRGSVSTPACGDINMMTIRPAA